jgi:hypothetical protein
MSKKSKHPRYDDPSAFYQRFPTIVPSDNGGTLMGKLGVNEQCYKMGGTYVTLTRPQSGVPGYFLSIHGRGHYPSWDEIVWLRYNLIPDAARMALILPNLNSYINQEKSEFKFVFTMEQSGWALDPTPTCSHCGKRLAIIPASVDGSRAAFQCPEHGWHMVIEMSTWNEEHGNGFLGATP